MSPGDNIFYEGFFSQERDLFNRIKTTSQSEAFKRIVESANTTYQSAEEAIRAIIASLATFACKTNNVSETAQEIAAQLKLADNSDCLARPLDSLIVRLLDLILHPGAPHMLAQLRQDVKTVLDALELRQREGLAEVCNRFKGLDSLADTLESGTPTEAAFKALVAFRNYAQQLSPNSAAQFYIWLRHFAELSRDDIFSFKEIGQLLLSVHVQSLLSGDELTPYLKIRLATCCLASKRFVHHRELIDAIMILSIQSSFRSQISGTPREIANAEFAAALQKLTAIVEELGQVELQARELGLDHDVWSCCMERGGTRWLTGIALVRNMNDESAMDNWIRPSLNDFRNAIEAAGKVTSPEIAGLVLKPAFDGLNAARVLNDEAAISEFSAHIEGLRLTGLYDEQIAKRDAAESHDLLNEKESGKIRQYLSPDDEKGIQSHTDYLMKSTGWPSDRRPFVEDDVRKMARIEQVKDEYCQHLQALQNLRHMNSPSTAYTAKTRYVAACELLGYEMSIEVDDIDTTIEALKRLHCNSCEHRSPRRGEPTSDTAE